MVEFTLTEEQKSLQEMAKKFALQEIRPIASECDRNSQFPESLFKKAWQTGLMNEFIPQNYGGSGLNLFETCLLIEEISYGCPGVATSLFCNHLALAPLVFAGTSEQKKKYFERFLKEYVLG